MKHLLKSMAYLAVVGLFLGAFDIASDVAIAAFQEYFAGGGTLKTAIYMTIASAGIVWLGCEVFQLYSKYTTLHVGKPLLDKYQKELEAGHTKKVSEWAERFEKIRLEVEELKAKNSRLDNDLHRSRCTAIKFEAELLEAQEELKVLRGPLELSKPDTNA